MEKEQISPYVDDLFAAIRAKAKELGATYGSDDFRSTVSLPGCRGMFSIAAWWNRNSKDYKLQIGSVGSPVIVATYAWRIKVPGDAERARKGILAGLEKRIEALREEEARQVKADEVARGREQERKGRGARVAALVARLEGDPSVPALTPSGHYGSAVYIGNEARGESFSPSGGHDYVLTVRVGEDTLVKLLKLIQAERVEEEAL